MPEPTSEYPPVTWRLLDTGVADGPTNMAIDEAILLAVAAGQSLPTLRFYGWEPACLSLGYAQQLDEVDRDGLAQHGWDLVRRPTGGRAILHVDELTYSIIAMQENEPRVAGGVLESYQRLSAGLLEGLHVLGLLPERAKPVYHAMGDHGPVGPACFDGPSAYEIVFGGFKLVGSAQMRRQGVVLQHGTLPLHGDITRIVNGLVFDGPGERHALAARLHFRATTLHQSLGRRVEYAEAAAALARGVSKALRVQLENGDLNESERAGAARLRTEKYATEGWTARA